MNVGDAKHTQNSKKYVNYNFIFSKLLLHTNMYISIKTIIHIYKTNKFKFRSNCCEYRSNLVLLFLIIVFSE